MENSRNDYFKGKRDSNDERIESCLENNIKKILNQREKNILEDYVEYFNSKNSINLKQKKYVSEIYNPMKCIECENYLVHGLDYYCDNQEEIEKYITDN